MPYNLIRGSIYDKNNDDVATACGPQVHLCDSYRSLTVLFWCKDFSPFAVLFTVEFVFI